jgi:hypothetical protein
VQALSLLQTVGVGLIILGIILVCLAKPENENNDVFKLSGAICILFGCILLLPALLALLPKGVRDPSDQFDML